MWSVLPSQDTLLAYEHVHMAGARVAVECTGAQLDMNAHVIM